MRLFGNIDASKATGALVGTDLGQLICASLQYFGHVPINSATQASVIAICVFLVSHLVPNVPKSTENPK